MITIEDARAQAKKILAEVANGKNPFDEIKARRSNIITVKEVLEDYISTRYKGHLSTKTHKKTFHCYFCESLFIFSLLLLASDKGIFDLKG